MKLFKRFISYYKPHKALFAIDMFCSLAVAICDLFFPVITRNIINVYVPDKNLQMLIVWSVALLAIYILKAVLNYVIQYWGHVMGVRIQGDMRRDMFRHLQKLPFAFFDDTKTGTIMSRMTNDLMNVSELAHHGPEDLFISTMMLIGSFVMLSRINLLLTCIVFAIVPFMVWFAVVNRKHMHEAFRRTKEEIAEINANVETAITGIRVSRSYTSESHENANFDVRNEAYKIERGKAYKAMGRFHSGMTLFNDIMYLIALFASGLFFMNGKIDAGDFAAFILYITMFQKPINRLVSLFEQIQDGITGLTRFEQIIEQVPEEEPKNPIPVDKLKGHIVFDNVSFTYKADSKNVISTLSMDIPCGKTVALVGPSGGGKTTLCHLIPRFYELLDGKITIDGVDITQMSRYDLRKNIGLVAQDVFLFNGSIRENIAYGDLDATDEQIIEAAKKAKIHDYVMTLPDGYDTNVGDRGLKLSGGQKQRISIARVFLKNPSILILDEATSALDNATEMYIQESLYDLAKGRTCIVVAHRLSTIKDADEIIVMTADGIAERGTHDQLLEKKGIYAELYSYQFKAENR